MNIPNILTAVRFAFIPFFAYYLVIGNAQHKSYYVTAVVIFLLAGLTDIMDGYIARKYNMITSWGKLADPLADKLMQITALFILTVVKHFVSPLLLAVVLIKEIFMGIGSLVLYKQDNYVVSANWYGKMATVLFYLSIVLIIFMPQFSLYFVLVAVIATLFAFSMYIKTFRQIKKVSDKNI